MISTRKRQLIKQFHTVCSKGGITTDNRRAIVGAYGCESSRELTEEELEEIIGKLNADMSADGDKWRKRVMASIGAWLRRVNIEQSPVMIKAIACRASGYPHFNAIPVSRLRDVYYEFVRKAKTVAGVQEFKQQIAQYLENCN